jgi:hypothetical protein
MRLAFIVLLSILRLGVNIIMPILENLKAVFLYDYYYSFNLKDFPISWSINQKGLLSPSCRKTTTTNLSNYVYFILKNSKLQKYFKHLNKISLRLKEDLIQKKNVKRNG